MALSYFTRPDFPYVGQSLSNSTRFQILTRSLNAPPTDNMFDWEFDAVTDYLNELDVKIENLIVGILPGVDNPANTNYLVSTDGTNQIWTKVSDENVQVGSLNGDKLADHTVTPQQIQLGSLTNEYFAPNADISGEQIADGTITHIQIADNANISGTQLAAAANIIGSQLSANANLLGTQLAANANILGTQMANNTINITQIAAAVLNMFVPIGTVIEFAGTQGLSANFLECNGQAVSRAIYPVLFNNIGVTYGNGDGFTTFNLPDRRGRVPVGIGSDNSTNGLITNATAPTIGLGQTFGSQTQTLDITQIPSHTHTIGGFLNAAVAGPPNTSLARDPIVGNITSTSSSTGGGLPHPNVQPSMFTRYYIRAL